MPNENERRETFFLDYNSDIVQNFLNKLNLENLNEKEKAIRIYYAVRDEIKYDPYHIDLEKESLKSSSVIQRKYGYCVEKALTLCSCLRGTGIYSRIGFANVVNHLNSKRLASILKTDVFAYHGYTEIYINCKWVKATPAFNKELCERANIKPLEFNGEDDSIFHPFDNSGNKHMEYIHDYGVFEDLPFERILDSYEEFYPHLEVRKNKSFGIIKKVKFEDEVISNQ
jgi:transglutaminase-like putative cysteine protease